MIAGAMIIAIVSASDTDGIDRLQAGVALTDAYRTLLALPASAEAETAITHARSALTERLARTTDEVARIDRDPSLLTDPALRDRRSELAVTTLRLRLPIALARLTAIDSHATTADLREAIGAMEAIDYVWGHAEVERHAALGALHLRLGLAASARAHFEAADGTDPLVVIGRTACRAAAGDLDSVPFDTDRLAAAIAGAAIGPAGPDGAAALAERALRTSPIESLASVRAVAYETLATFPRRSGRVPDLIRVARATNAAEARDAGREASVLAHAEALRRVWSFEPGEGAAGALAEVVLSHPNPDAAHEAAVLLTPHLDALAPSRRAKVSLELLTRRPHSPLADRWRLAFGTTGPIDAALDALDAVRDPAVRVPAVLTAARRAAEALEEHPGDRRAAEHLARRAQAARSVAPDVAWDEWLLTAEARGRLVSDGTLPAARWLLDTDAAGTAAAARVLMGPVLAEAFSAERNGDTEAQRDAARLGAELAGRAGVALTRATALNLAGEHDAALRVIEQDTAADAVLLERAEALFGLGRDEDAFALYRRLAATREATGQYDDLFWRGWSRMLQIAARHDTTGDREDEIVREIARLRILQKRLGGDPHRRRLESLLPAVTPGQADR